MTVDMNGKTGQACILELAQQLRGQGHRIGEQNRLDALLGNTCHDVHDVRVEQWLSTGDRDVVRVAPALEKGNLVHNLFQGFVVCQSLAITALAVEIADVGDFEPRDGIVVLGPRETVQIALVKHPLFLH